MISRAVCRHEFNITCFSEKNPPQTHSFHLRWDIHRLHNGNCKLMNWKWYLALYFQLTSILYQCVSDDGRYGKEEIIFVCYMQTDPLYGTRYTLVEPKKQFAVNSSMIKVAGFLKKNKKQIFFSSNNVWLPICTEIPLFPWSV